MSTPIPSGSEREWTAGRRRLYWQALILSPLVGFPLSFLVAVLGGPSLLSYIIAGLSVVLGIVLGLRLQLARCPRCRNLFWSIPGRWHFMWPTKSCRHCGFPEERHA
jgi:hypothetical protein